MMPHFVQIVKTGPGYYLLLDSMGQLWRGSFVFEGPEEVMNLKILRTKVD